MKLDEFRTLKRKAKTWEILVNGTYLTSRNDGKYSIDLFQLFSFYVEVFFNNESQQINYIRSFNGLEELGPYLEQMDLSRLMP